MEFMNEDIKGIVRTAFKAIALGNVEEMLNLCLDETTLNWGPFKFKGKAEIRKWAKDLSNLFASFSFVETKLTVSEDEAAHAFLIETINKDMSKGMVPATGMYTLKEGKFKSLIIKLGSGLIFQKPSEIDRWREELRRRSPPS